MVQLVRNSEGILEAELEGKKYSHVKLIRKFPFTMPDQYISVRTQEDEEVTLITNISVLEEASRREAEQELQAYDMITQILNVISIKRSEDLWLWTVDTDYGRMVVRMNERFENLHPLSPSRWILTDIEGRRFTLSNN
ncbi:hypothetical protein J2T13_000782 [Paenibacillus sp. DS2015]|uniref:DUF1854 domain-containing protein n=1 Tax=Paenibacillus sp. DS2015 TaxID=3373917 RepID=UPI003D1B2E45